MKIYNPFKAHIIQFEDGSFAIRKLNLFYFVYLNKNPKDNYWWMLKIYRNYFLFDNYEDCKKRYLKYFEPSYSKTKFIEQ